MRETLKYTLAAVSLGMALWVVYLVSTTLPLEVQGVGAYQNIYFHVGSFATAFSGFFLGLVASLLYLKTGNFKYDSFAAGVNEIALVFATTGLVMGSIWGRYAWGIWWGFGTCAAANFLHAAVLAVVRGLFVHAQIGGDCPAHGRGFLAVLSICRKR